MTDDRLAELERLCAAATPGPWAAVPGERAAHRASVMTMRKHKDTLWKTGKRAGQVRKKGERESVTLWFDWLNQGGGPCWIEDAAFIAAARTALPELIAEVRRLREAVAAEREACARIADPENGTFLGACDVETGTAAWIAKEIRARR